MSSGRMVTQELSIGEVISKTFDLYRRNFVKYFVLYLVVEAIIGVVSALAYHTFVLPTLPPHPTSQDVINWFPGFFSTLIALIAVIGIAALVFGPIAAGGTVKMASEEIDGRPVELGTSVRFAASKLIWMWALGIIVGIIVGLGFIALVIPGIILLIMFCLAFPVLLLENVGVIGSLGRSRELVSHRWLKTFAIFIVWAIIIGIAAAIVSAISSPFGWASSAVSSILGAFYQPLIPITITLYYYSNLARMTPAQTGPMPWGQTATPQPGMKFCPNCGTQLLSSATFCAKCGAKQPA
jgi:MFS family permease